MGYQFDGVEYTTFEEMLADMVDRLVLVRSDRGDGGWSLHAPGSGDDAIASGDAPPLLSGPSEWDDGVGGWSRPNQADLREARRRLLLCLDEERDGEEPSVRRFTLSITDTVRTEGNPQDAGGSDSPFPGT